MDNFYTPRDLADYVVACCKNKPGSVGDFAAGDGSLLRAAVIAWPKARIVAFDLDGSAIAALANSFPKATLNKCDFLSIDDPTRFYGEKVDLVLLNPPFSVRGNVTVPVRFGNEMFKTSRAMAFVANALKWLADQGELVAIVPSSCLTSQRDRPIREFLSADWKIERRRKDVTDAFAHCQVSVDVIRVSRRSQQQPRIVTTKNVKSRSRLYSVTLMRGTCPAARGQMTGRYPLIHTTNLRESSVQSKKFFVSNHFRKVRGKAVLLPRVGRPSSAKVAVKNSLETVILTDCVFALQTYPSGFEYDLANVIRSKWQELEELYTGTCARYLTASDLQDFLERVGVTVTRVGNMAPDEQKMNVSRLRPLFPKQVPVVSV